MEKKSYRVAEGVSRINGTPVPAGRRVQLTDSEALYERAVGRIVPATRRKESPDSLGSDDSSEA